MLQKFKKSSDSPAVDLPRPPDVDQMFADIAKLRPQDPLVQLFAVNPFFNDFGETTSDGLPSNTDQVTQGLSKLFSLCSEIRNAGDLLKEKKEHLKSLSEAGIEKRNELESIISREISDTPRVSGEDLK